MAVGEADDPRGEVTTIRLRRAQRLVAERTVASQTTVPDFTVTMDVAMDAAVELRERLKRDAERDGAVAPSLNDLIVKSCALALRRVPEANASFGDGTVERYARVNVGIAVAAGENLAVPVVMDADRLTVAEIARATRSLAQRVRDRTITPDELTGGTFTVSNLGMTGVRAFTAVINAPQAAILAVGAVRPVLEHDGQGIVRRRRAELTLTCDHRVLYGAHGAALLAEVRDGLEDPARLL
jgi:pyruvate dehydrogenase E2 component (dihydrolipoamide acetyltransferase)